MATLTRNTVTTAGLDQTANMVAADVAGDEVDNDVNTTTRTEVVITNGGGGGITVTLDSQANCSFGFDHDEAIAIGAGETYKIGPLPKGRWNDTADQKVKWTYSGVTSVTVGVFEYP